MKIYRKNELRDIVIAFLAFASVLTVAVMVKDKQKENSPKTLKDGRLMAVKQQGRVHEKW